MSTQDNTVRELAVAAPAAVRVLEKYGIDYCCGGHRPLADACRERGVSPETILSEVAAADIKGQKKQDWATAKLTSLIDHIVKTHHVYLTNELPAIEQRMAKVVAKHGQKYPEVLAELQRVFSSLKFELEAHLQKEERILFPAIGEMEVAAAERRTPRLPPFGTVRNPIRMMEHEHDGAGEALRAMRHLTHDYALPPGACATFQALYRGLEALESDLHTHIHLENNILFPRAAALEATF